MKKAYITLLSSEDYLDAVLSLNENLKIVKSKYPLVVAVTDNLLYRSVLEPLKKADIIIEMISQLSYPTVTAKHLLQQLADSSATLNTASKFNLFKLTNYEKLVYIDADVVLLDNIDAVFDYPDGAMLEDYFCDKGHSGLFVFCPEKHPVDLYTTLLANTNLLDGDIFGELWHFTRSNPNYIIPYNYLQTFGNHNENAKAIHFCSIKENKPWTYYQDIDNWDEPIIKFYLTLVNYIQKYKKE